MYAGGWSGGDAEGQGVETFSQQGGGLGRCAVATHLARFLVFAVLHRIVDVAQNRFDRIRICQVKWEERNERVILDLSCIGPCGTRNCSAKGM